MGGRIKVCVVDDHPEAAEILCEGLSYHDYESFACHSGQEALDLCAAERIDLVLLDIVMPGMDGFEVCKRLKEAAETKHIAVIFVSGKDAPDDVSKGYTLGAVDYITKPYNLPMVMVRVESALQKMNQEQPLHVRHEGVMDSAYTDNLTGLRNRRYLMERIQEEVEKAHRYNYPVSCAIFDVDDIQAIDEETGSVEMNDLLVEIAMAFRNYSRAYDVLARYDDSMFAVMLPHTPLEDAIGYGKKLMDEIDATTFSDPNYPTRASMSVGVVTCQNGDAINAELIFGEAMRSLLKAKSLPEKRIVGNHIKTASSK